MTTENNQIDTEATDVVPRKYKLLTEGDLGWRLSAEQFDELSGMVLESVAEENLGSEYGITLGDTIDILVKGGVPRAYAESQAHDYIKGRAFQTEEPQALSEIVKSKASSLERRLLGIHQSLGLNRYGAEENIEGIDYVTKADMGNMTIEVFGPNTERYLFPDFTVNVGKGTGKDPEKPEVRYQDWSPVSVVLAAFPVTTLIWSLDNLDTLASWKSFSGDKDIARSWFHDVYVLPFKYVNYLVKKAVHGGKKQIQRFREPNVIVEYDGKLHSLEEFIGYVVGTVDSDSDQNKTLREAVKNLVPALERDLTQAQDYANDLEV